MVGRLLDAVDGFETLPHRYKVVANRGSADEVRSMPVGNYLVRYHVDDTRRIVTILSVRHGARKPGR